MLFLDVLNQHLPVQSLICQGTSQSNDDPLRVQCPYCTFRFLQCKPHPFLVESPPQFLSWCLFGCCYNLTSCCIWSLRWICYLRDSPLSILNYKLSNERLSRDPPSYFMATSGQPSRNILDQRLFQQRSADRLAYLPGWCAKRRLRSSNLPDSQNKSTHKDLTICVGVVFFLVFQNLSRTIFETVGQLYGRQIPGWLTSALDFQCHGSKSFRFDWDCDAELSHLIGLDDWWDFLQSKSLVATFCFQFGWKAFQNMNVSLLEGHWVIHVCFSDNEIGRINVWI